MDDAAFMRRFQAFGDLARDRDDVIHRQRAAQFVALHQFHHQRALLDPIDGGDVGMVQRVASCPRFALGARHVLERALLASAGGRTLMATSRFSLVSRAR